MIPQEENALRTKKRRFRKTKPPLLMFSQRNNPYCELLQISAAKIRFFLETAQTFQRFLYLWLQKEENHTTDEENTRFGFRHKQHRLGSGK